MSRSGSAPRLLSLLRALLPRGIGEAALADLEREHHMRRGSRGERWTDGWWLAREGIAVAFRLRIEGARRAVRGRLAGIGVDFRLVLRGLARSPGLALAACLVLALGVGAPTTMYTIGRAIGADLPVDEPERLVHVGYTHDRAAPNAEALTLEELRALRERPGSLGSIAGYTVETWDLGSGVGEPERVTGARITHDLFSVLGESMLLGRGLVSQDAAEPVALVGERLWRERFGADPSLLSSTIRLNGEEHAVVGIVPEHLLVPDGAEIWVPLNADAGGEVDSGRRYGALGRRPDGVDLERVGAELIGAGAGLYAEAGSDAGARLVVRSYRAGSMISPRIGVVLSAMVALVSCLLLVAAANVANLLLTRAVARRRELAVRIALGAGRARLITHHLLEASALAMVGGLLGVGFAAAATEIFRRTLAHELAWWMVVELDYAVLGFAAGLVGLAAIVAGGVPALQTSHGDVYEALKGDARSGGGLHLSRLSHTLVVTEVMFSAALLVVAALMVKGAVQSSRWTLDYDTRGILAAAYTLRPPERLDEAGAISFHRALLEGVEGRPGVAGASLTDHLPGLSGPIHPFELEGAAYEAPAEAADNDPYRNSPSAQVVHVSPGFFDLLDKPIQIGRDFTWLDGAADPPAVLVNEAFVRRFLPGQDPIGRRIRILPPVVSEPVLASVVGIAPSLSLRVPDFQREEMLYLPVSMGVPSSHILIEAPPGQDPLALLPTLRGALRSLDPDKALFSIDTLDRHIRRAQRAESIFGALFATFGLAGLLMAGTGLYAVMAFAVGRRTREVGVRVALGAGPARTAWTIMRGAALQLALGLALGLLVAVCISPFLGEALSGVSPWDPAVYAGVTAVLLATGVTAAAVPALRVMRVKPSEAFRTQ